MTPRDALARARANFRSGPYLPRRARREATRAMLVATEHTGRSLSELVDALLDVQLAHPYVKPILLVGQEVPDALRLAGFVYETCLGAADLATLRRDLDAADYRRERIRTMIDAYQPATVVELEADQLPSVAALTGAGRDEEDGTCGDAGR